MVSSEIAISAEGVVRRFGKLVALDEVDVAVRSGEVYGFLAPTGLASPPSPGCSAR